MDDAQPGSGGYLVDLTTLEDTGRIISTGSLPIAVEVREAIDDAYLRFQTVRDGDLPTYYPALAEVDPNLFGISVVSTSGDFFAVGDSAHRFSIMSVSKPFLLAIVLELIGPEALKRKVGVDATGYPFNSGVPIDIGGTGRSNPMVNAGALATTSLVPGCDVEERWRVIASFFAGFAGRELALDQEIFASASASNHRNRALANLLYAQGLLYADPMETVDLYTRQCSLAVSAFDLSIMGATLADGGVNPRTGKRVVGPDVCRRVLAVMATAGMYETTGEWLFDVGLPAKSGVGGGIVTVSPGKGSLATFAPPLDAAGNSVRGQLVARYLSQRLGLDLFSSQPNVAHYDAGSTAQAPRQEKPRG